MLQCFRSHIRTYECVWATVTQSDVIPCNTEVVFAAHDACVMLVSLVRVALYRVRVVSRVPAVYLYLYLHLWHLLSISIVYRLCLSLCGTPIIHNPPLPSRCYLSLTLSLSLTSRYHPPLTSRYHPPAPSTSHLSPPSTVQRPPSTSTSTISLHHSPATKPTTNTNQ